MTGGFNNMELPNIPQIKHSKCWANTFELALFGCSWKKLCIQPPHTHHKNWKYSSVHFKPSLKKLFSRLPKKKKNNNNNNSACKHSWARWTVPTRTTTQCSFSDTSALLHKHRMSQKMGCVTFQSLCMCVRAYTYVYLQSNTPLHNVGFIEKFSTLCMTSPYTGPKDWLLDDTHILH